MEEYWLSKKQEGLRSGGHRLHSKEVLDQEDLDRAEKMS